MLVAVIFADFIGLGDLATLCALIGIFFGAIPYVAPEYDSQERNLTQASQEKEQTIEGIGD
jgi:hypothetical protein